MGKKNKLKKGTRKITRNKKKILIGAGVAAVAIAAIGGTLFVGKKIYDKKKGAHGSRAVIDDGPESPALSPYHIAQPKTYMDVVNIPDAVALGLSYDEDTGARMNLLAAAYDHTGQNLGYIQNGNNLTQLFGGAISHIGEAQVLTLGDDETIVADLRALPAHVSIILFGAFVIQPPSQGMAKAYVHMLPMLREEQIQAQTATGGTREIEYDSDEEINTPGSRGIGPEEDDDDDLVQLFHDDLDKRYDFVTQKGFVGGKIFRNQYGGWSFQPYRLVVPADPNAGVWPAFEHYARQPTY